MILSDLILFFVALAAGAINSVAGGGTLLTFPTLISLGIPPTVANATSTVALVPGSASAYWSYRSELGQDRSAVLWMGIPSILGGLLGAWVLLHVSETLFSHLVPWLILGATVLFIIQEPVSRTLRTRQIAAGAEAGNAANNDISAPAQTLWARVSMVIFQFFIAVYGGFFGAGIGILMLAGLGLMGFHNIHRMNALKNFAAICINGIASLAFIIGRHVDWKLAVLMAVGAILGGYGGAGIAQRIGQKNVRRLVVAIGLIIAAAMFIRQFHLA